MFKEMRFKFYLALPISIEITEYSYAAEPPVRYGVSHRSGQA